jgi:LPXTG-motif cell wall-anchored protein
MRKRFFYQLVLTTALSVALTTSAFGQAIGLNFTGGNNAGAPTALLPTDVAGATYQQANWNNANGTSGTLTGLVNQAGVATSASATWHADGTWGSGTGTANGNFKLYNGYLDATGTSATTVTISGLTSAGIVGPYDVYVYFTGDAVGQNRSGNYTIDGITEFALDNTGFKGTYVQATPGNGNNGNYVVFAGLTGDSFTLSALPVNFRSPVNAVQVFSESVPEPASLALAGVSLLGFAGYVWKRRRKST